MFRRLHDEDVGLSEFPKGSGSSQVNLNGFDISRVINNTVHSRRVQLSCSFKDNVNSEIVNCDTSIEIFIISLSESILS